jgi:hypothetical protein
MHILISTSSCFYQLTSHHLATIRLETPQLDTPSDPRSSFEENHKQPTGSILDQNVDVRARLDEMETRVYTSDYAFQSEVSDLSEWFGLARWIVELIVGYMCYVSVVLERRALLLE